MISVKIIGIDEAIRKISDYPKTLDAKLNKLCERLASMGATNVSLGFSRAIYDGPMDTSIEVQDRGNNTFAIVASGTTILFAEFGAGVTYGYGHPQAAEFGYGPGTYNPSSDNWNNPNGWWYKNGGASKHTYGNPPNMPMYNTAKDLRKEIERVAQEVFCT